MMHCERCQYIPEGVIGNMMMDLQAAQVESKELKQTLQWAANVLRKSKRSDIVDNPDIIRVLDHIDLMHRITPTP